MNVAVRCPRCGKRHTTRHDLLGRHARCEQCRQKFRLVAAEEETHEAAAETMMPGKSHEVSAASPPSLASPATPLSCSPPPRVPASSAPPRPPAKLLVPLSPAEVSPSSPFPPPSSPPPRVPASSSGSADESLPKKIARFEIRGRLGLGGFGTVYLAWDPVLEREVALKVPRQAVLENEKAKARFLREPKAAAQLRHPNIVPVFDAGQDEATEGGEGQFYIASAYIEGRTLEDLIEDDRPSHRRAAEIVRDLAAALDYAHRLGVVHRDVKPSNVMLDAGGTALLMDFGLARIQQTQEKLTHDGAVMGTPAYMAPEQADRSFGEVGPAADQYSLGVILYELLTGHRPFTGPPSVVIFNALHHAPKPPREIDLTIPKDLETICLKAMGKKVKERFRSCYTLHEELRRFNEGDPIRTRRMGLLERSHRWAKKNPMLATACAVSIILGVCSLIAAIALGNYANQLKQAQDDAQQRGEELSQVEESLRTKEKESKLIEARLNDRRTELSSLNTSLEEAQRNVKELTSTKTQLDEATRQNQELEQELREANRKLGEASTVFESTDVGKRATAYHNIALAARAYRVGKAEAKPASIIPESAVARMIECLDRCPLKCRHWEWYYTRGLIPSVGLLQPDTSDSDLTKPQQTVLARHDNEVTSVCARGDYIVSGSRDGTVRVWNAKGDSVARLTGHEGTVTCVSISLDGTNRIASGGTDRTIKLWDFTSGREIKTLTGHTGIVLSVAFDKQGDRLVSGSGDGTLKIWDLNGNEPLCTVDAHKGYVTSVGFSNDGEYIVSGGSDKLTMIWDARDGSRVHTFPEYDSEVRSVTFSPDDQYVATGCFDGIIRIYKVKEREPTFVLTGHELSVQSVAFSSDGRYLASGSLDSTVGLWSAKTGQSLARLAGHTDGVECVAFAPKDSSVVSGGRDSLVKISRGYWQDAHGETQAEGGPPSWFFSGTSRKLMLELAGDVCAISPHGELIASGNGHTIRIWDLQSGQQVRNWRVSEEVNESLKVTSIAFSPDGSRIVTGASDNSIVVWDASTGVRFLTMKRRFHDVVAVSFRSDGKQIASVTSEGMVNVWDAADGRELSGGQIFTSRSADDFEHLTAAVAFSADLKQVVVPRKEGAKLVSIGNPSGSTFLREHADLREHAERVSSVAFSTNGKRIVTGSLDDCVQVWNAAKGEHELTLQGHLDDVSSVAFSPDGKRIVSASADTTIRLWDAETGQEALVIPGINGITSDVLCRR